jgi:hypothetical protein
MKHLRDSKVTYFEHFAFAIKASILLGIAALASVIHSVLPWVCQGTSAKIVIYLYKTRLKNHPNPEYQKWINTEM